MEARRVPHGWILATALVAGTLVRLGTDTPALFRMAWLAFVLVAQGAHEIGHTSREQPSGPIAVVVAGILALFAGFLLLVVQFSDWEGHAVYSRFLLGRGATMALLLLAVLFLHARRQGWYREFASGPAAPEDADGKIDRRCGAAAFAGWLFVTVYVAQSAGAVSLRGPLLETWIVTSIASILASLACLFVGMGRGGRRRRLVAFANAAFLLAAAFLLDVALAPDFDPR